MEMKGYVLVLALVVMALLPELLEAGCEDPKNCCRRKDNSCRKLGPRKNKPNATTCFCDETCIILGDCCTDYDDVCRAQDCVLDDWELWGECSESCGWGHKKRARKVIREGKYGGKACENTEQKTYCLGIKCKGRRQNEGTREISETGSIIPAEYGSWRKNKEYNPYNDIRKNLFQHKHKDKQIKNPSYCARYEIVETRKACQNPLAKSWAASLNLGQTVCVECQPSAMKKRLGLRCKGHGAYLLETRWNAVTMPGCHGRWKMITEHEECTCDGSDDHSFILI